ncbi:MAG: hypothetical protein FWE03_03695 [Firmicutes bacterium]|nr:hypothetical protein [Bacillota bacterium]
MKAIRIDGEYGSCYLLTGQMSTIYDLISCISIKPNEFVKLKKLSNTRFPYFIEEDSKEVHVRFEQGVEIETVDVQILKREEYTKRLIKIVKEKCGGCQSYEDCEDSLGEIGNLEGHWTQIDLDGNCRSFRKNKQGIN